MVKKTKLIIILLILVPFLLWSCGKKGPLKLEPELLPLEVDQFKLTQLGKEIRLEWAFPEFLSDKETKTDLESIKKIHIYYADKEIPAGKFKRKSLLLKKRKINDLTLKDNTYSIKIPFKTNELDGKTHHFAVIYYHGKKKSPLSKVGSIQTIIPVKPLNTLEILKENKLIKLKWSKPELNIADKKIRNISGYKVYRKVSTEEDTDTKTDFTQLNKGTIIHEYFEDNDTGIDGNYSYYVTTTSSSAIESDPSKIAEVKITDIFPPEPPQNLVAFKHKDHLFLTWERVTERDLSHYKIYRKSSRNGADEFKILADKVDDNYFKDTKITKETTYSYYITAVDVKGNESEKSNIVKEKFN
ncbi:fibronectin type III domain-containing protein [Acidobacteriota bacterium]